MNNQNPAAAKHKVGGNNIMSVFFKIFISSTFILFANLQTTRLVVKFPGNYHGSGLALKTKAFADSKEIGIVTSFVTKKNDPALYVILKLKQGINIPLQSEFVFTQTLLGPDQLTVHYSSNHSYYLTKDTAIGVFKYLGP